jgi:putative hydrolase of the HAD superfamily
MAQTVKAVFLDVGGTLAYPHPSFHALMAEVCQAHGLAVTPEDAERVEAAVWAQIAEREDHGRGFSFNPEGSREFWHWVYRSFLIELDHAQAVDTDLPHHLWETFTRLESYRLYDDALPALQALRRPGLLLAVISNWEEWLEQLMANLGITEYFDFAVVSGVCGVEKPDQGIFQLALERAGVHPSEAVHVGDSLKDDVHGAAQVGIRPVLIDRQDRFPLRIAAPPPGSAGEHRGSVASPSEVSGEGPEVDRITSLLELPDLLGLRRQ